MNEQIHFMQETFQNGTTGEEVPGVTIIVDGTFQKVLDLFIQRDKKYDNYVQVIHDALILGINQMMRESK